MFNFLLLPRLSDRPVELKGLFSTRTSACARAVSGVEAALSPRRVSGAASASPSLGWCVNWITYSNLPECSFRSLFEFD